MKLKNKIPYNCYIRKKYFSSIYRSYNTVTRVLGKIIINLPRFVPVAKNRYFWSTNLDISLKKSIRTWSCMNNNPRVRREDLFTSAEIERVYIFFYRGQSRRAKHFSTEQSSLWVCAFVRGSARTVVQSPTPPSSPSKKGQKVHRQVARKNGPKRFELRCGERYAARPSGLETRTPFHPFPILPRFWLHNRPNPLCPLSLTLSDPFFAFSFFPRWRN